MIAALDRELWEPAAPSIVLVDGLDEVPDAQRPAVAAWITKRASAGGRRWVVTLRPEGFEMLGVDCCYLEVQPLDLPRIEALVKAHFGDDPAKALTLIADIRRRETYYQFARNPLLLRMMVDLHRSGNSAETRVEMYRKILLSVLDQRMRDKHGQVTMDGEQLLEVLGKVAWAGSNQGRTEENDRPAYAGACGGAGAGRVSLFPGGQAPPRICASQLSGVSRGDRSFGSGPEGSV